MNQILWKYRVANNNNQELAHHTHRHTWLLCPFVSMRCYKCVFHIISYSLFVQSTFVAKHKTAIKSTRRMNVFDRYIAFLSTTKCNDHIRRCSKTLAGTKQTLPARITNNILVLFGFYTISFYCTVFPWVSSSLLFLYSSCFGVVAAVWNWTKEIEFITKKPKSKHTKRMQVKTLKPTEPINKPTMNAGYFLYWNWTLCSQTRIIWKS